MNALRPDRVYGAARREEVSIVAHDDAARRGPIPGAGPDGPPRGVARGGPPMYEVSIGAHPALGPHCRGQVGKT